MSANLAEPTDPEQIKADMRKCPRWILLKLQSERQEKAKAEQAVASTREEIDRVANEVNNLRRKVEELEQKRSQSESIDKQIRRVTEALDEKDLILQQTDKLLLQKTAEADKYRNFIKEVQEIKMKADNQIQELLRSKDNEIKQKEEAIKKLESDAVRFKNFIRNAHKSIIFRPDTMQSLFKEQQLAISGSPKPTRANANTPSPGTPTILLPSPASSPSLVQPTTSADSSPIQIDHESLIPLKDVSDLVLKDDLLKRNIFRKWLLRGPEYDLMVSCIEAADHSEDVPVDKFAQAVVNFFEVSGPSDSLGLFRALIAKEVEKAEDETTLFRSNACSVKVIRAYFRLVGVDYLRTTLVPFIADVVGKAESLEVDPTKSLPGEDTAANLEKVKQLVEGLLSKICGSVDAIPLQLRVLFSHLAQEVKKKFETFQSFVGGFVFLRFICPAIAAPESFDFLSGTGLALNESSRRTCILVSKLLQNVANGVTFKESYLLPLNEWMAVTNKRIHTFVEQLLEISSDAASDTVNFAPVTIMTSMEHCVADIQKYMCDLKSKLIARYEGNTERFVEGMSFSTPRLLSVILASGLLALQGGGEPPFLRSFSKILLTTEKLLPAICKQAMKRKGTSLDSLASAMVSFWGSYKAAPVMLKSLIRAEVYCTDYVFVDSFSSKVFAYYCQYFSRNVLNQMLAPHVQNILQNNVAIEIEEDRMIPTEKHKKGWNIQLLLEHTKLFFEQFTKLIPSCPFPIWDICNFLVSGDLGHSQDICEFLFFAWFCPVIEEPEKYGLVPEPPKPALRRTFSLISDVLRKVAKGNVFYTKDTSFKQLNEWIEAKADEVAKMITEWAKEPSDDLSLITQDQPPIDDAVQEKALSTIHHFMMTKATFFSHVLSDERFDQGVAYTMQDLVEGLLSKPLPVPEKLEPAKSGSGIGSQSPSLSSSAEHSGREKKREKSVRTLTKLTSQLKKGVGTFIEESSSLFDTPKDSPTATPPMLNRLKDSVIVGSMTKLQELDDPELAKARDKLYETLTSFYTNETEEDRGKRMRQEVVGELISTETTYIKSLQGIRQYVMEPLKSNNLVTPEELRDLFSNLVDLIPVNQKLLRNLQGVEDLPAAEQNIGEVFYSMISDLKVYKKFCVDMNKSLRVRERLSKKTAFTNFVNEATRNPDFPADCRNLDNLLIQPMQRICRYPLLLSELAKRTPSSFNDKEIITKALEDLTNIVQDINESRVQEERVSKLVDVIQRFAGDKKVTEETLITSTRAFIAEVACKKIKIGTVSGKGHLFLFDDLLLVGQPNKGRFSHVAQFAINPSIRADPSAKSKHTIELSANGHQGIFTLNSDEERDSWLQLLAQAQAGKFAFTPPQAS